MNDSGFDFGLADSHRANILFATHDDLAALAYASRDAGLHTARIDLKGCRDKRTLLLRMALSLEFPESSGLNWDALSDCLRDLSWLQATGFVLLFDTAADLRDADPDSFDTLLSILDEARADWAAANVPFWAFLALPEAELADED